MVWGKVKEWGRLPVSAWRAPQPEGRGAEVTVSSFRYRPGVPRSLRGRGAEVRRKRLPVLVWRAPQPEGRGRK
ncbi:hypothetical protein chiPu_0027425 [Chiloscyllium punctatum]|uniref:Uncharacterized protein n=1 Tax=Chiloscyllium punctatum TaxID=137246 RepID=A0A401TLL6_CHIPU|nr:hypothetical protein [Chiloscyllium punctatum]